MRIFLIGLLCLGMALKGGGQTAYAFRVKFKNKNGTLTYSDSLQFLSQKSLNRRGAQGIALDSTDLPLVSSYVTQTLNTANAIKLHNRSKWMNQIVLLTFDSTKYTQIIALPFVESARIVAIYPNFSPRPSRNNVLPVYGKLEKTDNATMKRTRADSTYYGLAWKQIHLMKGEYLHDLGFRGQNMDIGILDAGFKGADSFSAFDSLNNSGRVLAMYDFVRDTNTVFVQTIGDHGMNVLGCMGAVWPGTYVGTAPDANYYLFLTEDILSEQPVEEDNLLSGLEYCDSAGVDIVNISLGYYIFDAPHGSYTYAGDMNGHKTLSSLAVNFSSRKGILPVVAMGNLGASPWKYLITPGDADSAYSVGCVDSIGNYQFSGYGPNSSGRVKPDGAAMGWRAYLIGGNGGQVGQANGSSFASPMVCGSIASLWQAYPLLDARTIKDIVRLSSSQYFNPDSTKGFGIPDFSIAYQIAANMTSISEPKADIFKVYPNPFSNDIFILNGGAEKYDYQIVDLNGRVIKHETDIRDEIKKVPLYNARGTYILRISNGKEKQSIKLIKRID